MGAVLTRCQRYAIARHAYAGKTTAEIAAELGITQRGARYRIQRGAARLPDEVLAVVLPKHQAARERKKTANASGSAPAIRRGRVQSLHPDLLRSI